MEEEKKTDGKADAAAKGKVNRTFTPAVAVIDPFR